MRKMRSKSLLPAELIESKPTRMQTKISDLDRTIQQIDSASKQELQTFLTLYQQKLRQLEQLQAKLKEVIDAEAKMTNKGWPE